MSLLLQYGIIVSVWILSLLLILLIPRQKRRLAMVAFLFKQYITCIFGHAVVELKLLAYPVRELADVRAFFDPTDRQIPALVKPAAHAVFSIIRDISVVTPHCYKCLI
ncbi:hypothetical protein [Paenibacillus alba]|uniref:hypothetical protein n=1 Tax=Paenibacillus alba TaxID=1197127 RepID=UPI001FEABEB6|nr:hypothetical protein [Paenibacillus alba]